MPKAKIEWVQAASGGDVITYYGAGEVDLGLMGSAPAARSASEPVVRDVDIATIWIHDVIGDAESLIVKDAGVTDLAQLKGATIATPFSSTAHYSLLQALAEAGLDPAKDVTVINLDPEKMPAAWQGGEIDAAWVWDPVQSQLLEERRRPSGLQLRHRRRRSPHLRRRHRRPDLRRRERGLPDPVGQGPGPRGPADPGRPATAAESVAVVLGIDPGAAEAQFAGLEFHRASRAGGRRLPRRQVRRGPAHHRELPARAGRGRRGRRRRGVRRARRRRTREPRPPSEPRACHRVRGRRAPLRRGWHARARRSTGST